MKYQCTSCDITAKSRDDVKFTDCKEKKHHIVSMLDQKEIKSATKDTVKGKTSQKKIKGLINGLYVESIVVEEKSYFLCVGVENNILSTKETIETEDTIYRPLDPAQCGYIPYKFASSEIVSINDKISKDEIFDDVKRKIDRYVSLREIDKNLILGDIFLTYCQEWIGTIHFPFFVGETESGKSTVLHLGKWLAYRCHLGEDIPIADVYNFLGTDEEGTGTIAEDEAQELWKNREKIRTYKGSYAKGSLKARIIGVDNLGKHQVFYKTFCPKWFAGEKIPHDKGFLERLAIVHMTEGQPHSNIKRLSEDEMDQLGRLRNRLLVWKLQNISTGLGKISSKLKQRDQELWEDFLAVAYGTKYYDKFENVVQNYVEQRHDAIRNSFEAKILKIISERLDARLEITAVGLWDCIITDNSDLPGRMENDTFYPDDYNKFTKNSLSRLLEDKFHAIKRSRYEKDTNSKTHKITFYSFKQDVLQTLVKKYGINLAVNHPIYSGLSGQGSQNNLKSDHLDDLDYSDNKES